MTKKDLHGEIVTWDIASGEVSLSELRDAMVANDLPVDAVTEITNDKAFTRACKHLKKERQIDKLKKDGDTIRFQFTAKAKGSDIIDYDYECMIDLDMKSGDVSCPENPELAKQARELIQHAIDSRTSRDVSALVQRLFAANADLLPINPKGVAYFVPAEHAAFTTKVEGVLRQCGGRFDRFPVSSGTKAGDDSVRAAVSNGLSRMVEELNEAVAEWTEKTRSDTFERAEQRWEKIRHKVESYAVYLDDRKDSLMAEVEAAKAKLAARMAELLAEPETTSV